MALVCLSEFRHILMINVETASILQIQTNFIFCIHFFGCFYFSDLNVQIQALNQVLDTLDHQLDNIVEEIIRIRIPGR